MDLKESSFSSYQRHPWELARAKTITRVLSTIVHQRQVLEKPRVLDFGSGDSWLVHRICQVLPNGRRITCVDSAYSDEQMVTFRAQYPNSTFHKELPLQQFDFVFALDALEHVENDLTMLRKISELLPKDGIIFITVPAFQCLYTEHDRFLQHFRRYRLGQINKLLVSADLKIEKSGYFFASLLAPRALKKCMRVVLQVMFNGREKKSFGARPWRRARAIAQLFAFLWISENQILIWLATFKIRIPGLTVWAVCKKK